MVVGLWGVVLDDIVAVGVREPLEESSSCSLPLARPARRHSDCASRSDWVVDWRDFAARSMRSKGSSWWLKDAEIGAARRIALLDPGAWLEIPSRGEVVREEELDTR